MKRIMFNAPGQDFREAIIDSELDALLKEVMNHHSAMWLSSAAVSPNVNLSKRYTRDGENINPPLLVDSIPNGTQSLALVMEDLDAHLFDGVHWLAWNLPFHGRICEIREGALSEDAVPGLTDFGFSRYVGPESNVFPHRYRFRVFALDEVLQLPSKSNWDELRIAMRGHVLSEAALVVEY